MPQELAEYRYIANDEQITPGPLVLYGVLVEPDGTGGTATLHEGQGKGDSTIATLTVAATASRMFRFDPGTKIDRGLFMELDDHITSCTILWRPLKD